MTIFLDALFAEARGPQQHTRETCRQAGHVMDRQGRNTSLEAPHDAKARPRVEAAHRFAVFR
ncbi:hypothetical protein ACS5PN_21290 [Roseateles sp. NT4]|uniref:hypothetical protein n=1 Tax=Roseateles sp. NT4 TaxID=3453715 RepID=UPI003EEC7B3F